MLGELQALIPDGQDQGHQYRPSQPPAEAFWRGTWGARSLASWSEFQAGLQRVHPVAPGPMAAALRATMDLTCSDHVSIFEFDIFTRLFQPWPTLLKNWTHLAVTHPGYVAFLTYDEVRARLQTYSNKPGSYVFRLSCTRLGQWAIGYVSRDGSILQTIPQDRPLFQALIEGHKEGFYLYPDGKNVNPDLTELTESTPQNRIEVSPDQAQLYSQMGSTFQLCKICAENDKDVRLQPCGHLLCRDCLNAWQQVQAPTCPFCRRAIQGHEEIHIDPVGGQGAGAAPDEDDDDLEDVESVLQELAALRKAGHPAFPPCTDPEMPGPPVPPRLDLLQPRDPDPMPQDLPLPALGHPSQNPSDWIRHRPLAPVPGPGGPLPRPSPRGLRSPADGGAGGGVDSAGDTVSHGGDRQTWEIDGRGRVGGTDRQALTTSSRSPFSLPPTTALPSGPPTQVTREPRSPGGSSSAPPTAQPGSTPQDSQPDSCRPPRTHVQRGGGTDPGASTHGPLWTSESQDPSQYRPETPRPLTQRPARPQKDTTLVGSEAGGIWGRGGWGVV
ncbi:kynurenine/alpha-aminoadipate aminotransferase, mitochondrial-like [Platysternon megacephalum]|uniref:E3 ubiquitin-protein ligase CBL n=1 Tax=Platysternon megacephalum TaxID=55544 RepID=A0A4D9DLT1_9SAUR|nr:kynurenine/alpha-aminoadipate aminotransferase, mitochondrial-like [Platysternon megacephalum]